MSMISNLPTPVQFIGLLTAKVSVEKTVLPLGVDPPHKLKKR
jgi:hypothetical protein